MAKFMDVHSGFTGVTEDQLREGYQRGLEWTPHGAWFPGRVGHVVLPVDRSTVRRVHEKAGHPADEIYECRSRSSTGPRYSSARRG